MTTTVRIPLRLEQALAHDIGEAQHGVQRGAQFVTDIRREFTLTLDQLGIVSTVIVERAGEQRDFLILPRLGDRKSVV